MKRLIPILVALSLTGGPALAQQTDQCDQLMQMLMTSQPGELDIGQVQAMADEYNANCLGAHEANRPCETVVQTGPTSYACGNY